MSESDTQLKIDRLCRRIDYQFSDQSLLELALTHRSVSASNYERLEFLGDSLLGFVIAAELYHRHPDQNEGSLSRRRASLVNGPTLAGIAREIELGQCLKMGSGELKSGGFNRKSILADALESLLGAVYLDSDLEQARKLILNLFGERLDSLPETAELKDPKTRLQELLQGVGLELPSYELIGSTGKSHEKEFTVRCSVSTLGLETECASTSMRKAEQHAASMMLVERNILELHTKSRS